MVRGGKKGGGIGGKCAEYQRAVEASWLCQTALILSQHPRCVHTHTQDYVFPFQQPIFFFFDVVYSCKVLLNTQNQLVVA